MDPLIVLGVVLAGLLVGEIVSMVMMHFLDRWAIAHLPGYRPFPRPLWRYSLPNSWWWRKKWWRP